MRTSSFWRLPLDKSLNLVDRSHTVTGSAEWSSRSLWPQNMDNYPLVNKHSYWNWTLAVDLPIKHGVMLSLPEAMYNYGNTKIGFKAQFLYDTCSAPWSKFMSFSPSSCWMVSSQDYCIEAGMRLTENQEARSRFVAPWRAAEVGKWRKHGVPFETSCMCNDFRWLWYTLVLSSFSSLDVRGDIY